MSFCSAGFAVSARKASCFPAVEGEARGAPEGCGKAFWKPLNKLVPSDIHSRVLERRFLLVTLGRNAPTWRFEKLGLEEVEGGRAVCRGFGPKATAELEGMSTCSGRALSTDLFPAEVGTVRLAPLVPARQAVASCMARPLRFRSFPCLLGAWGRSSFEETYAGRRPRTAVLHGRVGALAEMWQHGMTCVAQKYELAILNLVEPQHHTIGQVTRRLRNVTGPRDQTLGIGPQPIGHHDDMPLLRHASLGAAGEGVKVDYGEPHLCIILRAYYPSLAKTWLEYLCANSSDGFAPLPTDWATAEATVCNQLIYQSRLLAKAPMEGIGYNVQTSFQLQNSGAPVGIHRSDHAIAINNQRGQRKIKQEVSCTVRYLAPRYLSSQSAWLAMLDTIRISAPTCRPGLCCDG
ncbi:hypothetical protein OOU_Y34scaffold00552g122 [Pyricularia oryzae Y34]|uniref:Uncharacterized protein n=1 Tax=Pyricularia oryzae (strain Y34) TaxID=1143189 RepID=A0AA97PKQ0_PYRO3|nr:hypothetical protein OOU_Y34scaffold00552g122 [Pyricularia oryzae Y34]